LSTAKKFAGQTAIYGASTIAGRMLAFFLTPLYTHAYGTGRYGILTTMFAWASILNAVLAFGMETTFFRYLTKYPDNKAKVYNNAFATILFITVIFLGFTLPFVHNIAAVIKVGNETTQSEFERFIVYFIAILIIDAWCVIPFARLRAEGKPGRYGLLKFINVLIYIVLNLVFIWVIPYWTRHQLPMTGWINGWYVKDWIGYVFLANVFSSAVTLLLLLPEFLSIRLKLDWRLLGEMFTYSWPVLIANLSFIINENADKLLLGWLLKPNISDHQVGIYGACAKISLFLSIFIQAFRLGAEPFFFSHAKHKNAGQTYAKIMDYFVIMVCVIFIALIANIEILKYFITRQSYWVGLPVVPPLVFGYVSLGIYMNLSVWYKLSDQTKYGLYISGVGAILTLIINFAFIPKYSYMASAWASLIAYASMMVLSYIWGQRNYPIPYNLRKNSAYILSSIIIVYLSFYVFKRNIFAGDALLAGYILTAALLEWKDFKTILNKK
jgi:O-antigen/teichoic acid export membrane protein